MLRCQRILAMPGKRCVRRTVEFLDRAESLLTFLLPRAEREGKAYLTLAVGCTGGKHRSVAIAAELAARVADAGTDVQVVHRDLGRE